MLRAILALVLTAVLYAGAPASAAEDVYILKSSRTKPGEKVEHEKTEEGKVTITAVVMEKETETIIATGSKEIFVEEVIERKDLKKKPTKSTRTYSVAEKTEKGETTKALFSGESVLIEKKGEAYELSIKGKALQKSDAPDLFKKFKSDDGPQNGDFLPAKGVKVGETWKVPFETIEKSFKADGENWMKPDLKKVTMVGKLTKAYKKDGAQFGVVELEIVVPVVEIDLGNAPTKADGKIITKLTIDACIDDSIESEDSKSESTIQIDADLPNGGTFKMSGSSKTIAKSRPVKK